PSNIDMLRIMRRAKSRHISLELNAQPERLDLDDTWCQMAREEGVLVSLNSDAHSIADFANLQHGVGQARRGWLEPDNVLNTRDLKTMLALLHADK
ncbi:MAG: DNA polymerase III, partial [Oxalobacteraceae bacterium]